MTDELTIEGKIDGLKALIERYEAFKKELEEKATEDDLAEYAKIYEDLVTQVRQKVKNIWPQVYMNLGFPYLQHKSREDELPGMSDYAKLAGSIEGLKAQVNSDLKWLRGWLADAER